MKLDIRRFQPKDAKELQKIGMRNFDEKLSVEAGGYLLPSVRKKWAYFFETTTLCAFSKNNRLLVAVDETRRAVGSVSYIKNEGRNYELVYFFVDPDYHGNGVGKALMLRTLSDLRKKGVGLVTLYSTLSAGRFYEHLGFSHVPELDHFRKEEVDREAAKKFAIETLPRSVGYRNHYFFYRFIDLEVNQ